VKGGERRRGPRKQRKTRSDELKKRSTIVVIVEGKNVGKIGLDEESILSGE